MFIICLLIIISMRKSFTLTPVYGERFVGRRDILREMMAEVTNPKSNVGFCLHGRRRVGKTSILRELEYELSRKEGIVVADLSLYDLADLSLKTFTEQLSTTILEAFREKKVLPFEFSIEVLMKSPKEVIESALSKFKIGTELSDEVKFFLEFRKEKTENYTEIVRRAFDLGEKLAKSSGTKFILVLDEFPEILRIENGEQLVKMFRTIHEKQRNTAIILSGSEKRTLELVALGSASPFYKQLVPKKISPFSFEETLEFLNKYGLKISESEAKKIYEITGGVPFYLQYLGRSAAPVSNIDGIVKEFLAQEGGVFFGEEFERLSDKEKLIAMAMAMGARAPTEISKGSGEPVTSVSRYLLTLQDKGVVKKIEKASYALADKLFSLWLKGRYGR